jgi:hypothetical protein
MNLTGETRMKLTGISGLNGERIARLDQDITASVLSALGPTGLSMNMTASGTGTVVWNLDRGYVKAGQTTIEIEAEIMQAKMPGRISTIALGSN